MYPSSSSSSSSSSVTQTGGLTRYGSAPSSLLTTTVDAVLGGGAHHHLPNYYSSASGGGDSSPLLKDHNRSYDAPSFGGSALLRQKSSPAGFLSHLASSVNHNQNAGFTITRGGLKSQLSFTGGQESCLSQISEEEDGAHHPSYGSSNSNSNAAATTTTFWDAASNSNSIAFSAPPSSKRSKSTNDPDFLHCLNALESQFSMPQTSLEMAAVEKLMHIPEDSVPCKIRAKRGCATHPRSIAERERRTRISGKLKKLQDLVPNMDKQTSYADMLDLAVQHIKGLQGQVQKLHKELENCTCGCKQST